MCPWCGRPDSKMFPGKYKSTIEDNRTPVSDKSESKWDKKLMMLISKKKYLIFILIILLSIGFLIIDNTKHKSPLRKSELSEIIIPTEAIRTEESQIKSPTIQTTPETSNFNIVNSESCFITFSSDQDGDFEIYLLNLETLDVSKITDSDNLHVSPSFSPSWSPDGKQIVFESGGFLDSQICSMNLDGTSRVCLSNNPGGDKDPTWSPDGKKVAFVSYGDGDAEIFIINSDGSNQIQLTNNNCRDANPTWSPDSNQIVYESDCERTEDIYIMNDDGSEIKKLTDNYLSNTNPQFSRDGNQIFYYSEGPLGTGIYAMKPDGTENHRLTINIDGDSNHDWSPEGNLIAFESNRDGDWEIYLIDNVGIEVVKLTNNTYSDILPSWSPNCRMEFTQNFIKDNFSNGSTNKNSQDSYGYFYETPQPPENINNYGDYLDVISPMLIKCKDEIISLNEYLANYTQQVESGVLMDNEKEIKITRDHIDGIENSCEYLGTNKVIPKELRLVNQKFKNANLEFHYFCEYVRKAIEAYDEKDYEYWWEEALINFERGANYIQDATMYMLLGDDFY